MAEWRDRYWTSADGLRLHYRDYDGPRDKPPILCIPGLTRNARDFEGVCDRLAGQWRIVAVDLRGRGLSEYDPDPTHYAPANYVPDIMKLLDQEGIADAVFVGTSLGGLVTMLVAAGGDEERIAGALINDIGPVIDRAGLEFIATYVGKDVRYDDWAAAAAALSQTNARRFPKFAARDWDMFARRLCREEGGSVRTDYDPAIAVPFKAALDAPVIDAWPIWRALDGRPVTILRAELSDLLSVETAERMASEVGDVDLVTVAGVGHSPTLDEPESIAALDRLLGRVLEREARPSAA